MAKVKLGDLQVDWNLNPRTRKNEDAVSNYTDSLKEYSERAEVNNEDFSRWFARDWDQRIEITKDFIVTKGAHTVEALREIYDDEFIIDASYAKIDGKYAEGSEDAKWLAAQSNKKGLPMDLGEVTSAIEFMLEQMQPTKDHNLDGMRPFMPERPLAAAVGCSRTQVNRVRKAWLIANGFIQPEPEEVEEPQEETKAPDLTIDEIADKAEELLSKAVADKKDETVKRKAKRKAAKEFVDPDLEGLQEDIDGLDDLDDSLINDVHPFDRDDSEISFSEDDIPSPEDDSADDIRGENVKAFETQMNKMIQLRPDINIFADIEYAIAGEGVDDGILRPILTKYDSAEVEEIIKLIQFILEAAAEESA